MRWDFSKSIGIRSPKPCRLCTHMTAEASTHASRLLPSHSTMFEPPRPEEALAGRFTVQEHIKTNHNNQEETDDIKNDAQVHAGCRRAQCWRVSRRPCARHRQDRL